MNSGIKHEVVIIKATQACDLLEEAFSETSAQHIVNRLQNLLRKHSLEIVAKGINAQ